MTSPINSDALVAMIALAEKQTQEKIALDIVYKHDVGCTCSFCESIRTRFPHADTSHPDRFEERRGHHESFPFDATNTVQLQSIAKSLHVVAVAVEKTASMLESTRDVLRGRDDNGASGRE